MFRGVWMRSRTEARWAAMFERLGWKWSYEPFDLMGYVPDFMLDLGATRLLCEVKATDEDFALAESKIETSGWEHPALIVGHDVDRHTCGRIRSWDGVDFSWGQARFFWCISCQQHSVLDDDGDWRCRRCGDGRGNSHVGDFEVDEMWASVGNAVQWKGPGT